ncbi:hypothetical protein ACH5RR_009330 [Cinchona calisaya]|uniref:Uncharacterized protein n=1 Tax=Cinchona calisaya TaxID=153742 RepID=A0ABD3AEQ0_9GENT
MPRNWSRHLLSINDQQRNWETKRACILQVPNISPDSSGDSTPSEGYIDHGDNIHPSKRAEANLLVQVKNLTAEQIGSLRPHEQQQIIQLQQDSTVAPQLPVESGDSTRSDHGYNVHPLKRVRLNDGRRAEITSATTDEEEVESSRVIDN